MSVCLPAAPPADVPADAASTAAVLPLTRDARLRLVRERLARGDYETLDAARAVARRLLRDDFADRHR